MKKKCCGQPQNRPHPRSCQNPLDGFISIPIKIRNQKNADSDPQRGTINQTKCLIDMHRIQISKNRHKTYGQNPRVDWAGFHRLTPEFLYSLPEENKQAYHQNPGKNFAPKIRCPARRPLEDGSNKIKIRFNPISSSDCLDNDLILMEKSFHAECLTRYAKIITAAQSIRH